MNLDLELEFPPKPEYVRAVRHTAAALARLHEVSDELVEDVKIAVSEACTKAVTANAEMAPEEPIGVLASVDAGQLIIQVVDRGPRPEHAVAGPPVELPTEEVPFDRALSVPLIRGLVDELAVTPREDGGARVRMVLSLTGQQSDRS